MDNTNTTFSIGIGKAAHAKHQFKVTDVISGEFAPVPDHDLEPTKYYKVSKLKLISQGTNGSASSPWELVPLELEVYRERGHRRLASRTYETFCYGPLNCKLYKAGPNRKVEGRNGMVYVEEDWVDAMNVEHRDFD